MIYKLHTNMYNTMYVVDERLNIKMELVHNKNKKKKKIY